VEHNIHTIIQEGSEGTAHSHEAARQNNTVYVHGVVEQHHLGTHRTTGTTLTAFASARVGINADVLPGPKGIQHAKRLSAQGARQMTLTIAFNRTLPIEYLNEVERAANNAISESLGVEYQEWFTGPDDPTFSSFSGLILCTPDHGTEIDALNELPLVCDRVTRGAFARALLTHYAWIS
jgi:hypothetical protein